MTLNSSRKKEDEKPPETAEKPLVKTLLEIVEKNGNGFYSVKITTALRNRLNEDWINPVSVGRMLTRLDLTEKKESRTKRQRQVSTDN